MLYCSIFPVLFEVASIPFSFSWGLAQGFPLRQCLRKIHGKIMNVFGATIWFNLHGYSLTTFLKNCFVLECGSSVSSGHNVVFTA